MTHVTHVDLHCHSRLSDGELAPEELAERLAQAGVAFASLTDHDTVEGLASFRAAAERRGIGCVSGLELTVRCCDQEAHLLAYGIDPNNPELLAMLQSLRHWRGRQPHGIGNVVHSIATDLRQRSSVAAPYDAGVGAGADGQIDIADAIALIHRSGGKAFLAHPLVLQKDMLKLRELLEGLRRQGLDGMEAIYAPFAPEDQVRLCELADNLGLLVCGGADQHQATPAGAAGFGVDMPRPMWAAFREAVAGGAYAAAGYSLSGGPGRREDGRQPHRLHLRQFALHIILPTLLAIALFVGATFALFLPAMERALLDRKREMIRELTNSAWSIVAEAYQEQQQGLLTRQQAQELAGKRVGAMRYGREGKDYFWLQDMHPRIVMHPYRPDLNGRDVTDFRDARGTRIFVEFADVVRRRNEGYVEYVWQWKDDPGRLAPKESYIRGFEPWGWIIGTGIYIEDVRQEIARIERNLLYGAVAISVMLAALLSYVMRESLRLERRRRDAEQHLRESSERYRSLVEVATEGTLLVLEGRCRYANPMLLEMLGYSAAELEMMDLGDLLGTPQENTAIWRQIERLGQTQTTPENLTAVLRRRDHSTLWCQVALRPIDLAGQSGLVLLARPSSISSGDQQRRAMIDRLLHIPEGAATDLAREVSQAQTSQAVAACCRRSDGLVRSLLDCGAHPRHVTRMLASVCDAATVRLLELATVELGPSPVPFGFIALGSQGRQEQTLCTDQDNAIVYEGAEGVDPAKVSQYFRQLGQRVCEGLAQAGYAPCLGGIMASNDRWCQPLATWKRYFDQWIAKAEPRELLDFSIFFDLRGVYGQAELAAQLRSHVQETVFQTPTFFPYFAANSLLFKPPLGLFGRIVTGGGDSSGMLDLKAAMMPIVSFARLYALKHARVETGTLDRLATLAAAGVLLESTRQEMQAAYESLMRLRLRHQCEVVQAGRSPDNLIDPHALGHIEKAILKESFTEIEAVQNRISYDFLGGPGA